MNYFQLLVPYFLYLRLKTGHTDDLLLYLECEKSYRERVSLPKPPQDVKKIKRVLNSEELAVA